MNDKENIFENTDEVKIIVRFNKQLIITRKNNIRCGYMRDDRWWMVGCYDEVGDGMMGWRVKYGEWWKSRDIINI